MLLFSLSLIAWIAAGSSAEAQQKAARRQVIVEIDGTFAATARTFSDTSTPPIHGEPGRITARYDIPRAPGFNAGALVHVWRQLSAGVSYGQSSRSTSARITGSLPHPFFFSRNRQIEGTAAGANWKRSTLAVQVRGSFPVARRTTLAIFGGPAWLATTQGVVEQVNYSEAYPYDTASFTSASVRDANKAKLSFVVGADVSYFLSRRLGVGGGFKYSAATIDLPSLDSDPLETKTGGLDVTTGIRLRF